MADSNRATLKIDTEVRDKLRAMKRGQETYSDLFRRLIEESEREPYTPEVTDEPV